MRESRAIQVDLGAQKAALDRRLQSGLYDDASDVMRAALRALEREEAAIDEVLREKVRASMADKRPSIPATDVFKRLRARHSRRVKVYKPHESGRFGDKGRGLTGSGAASRSAPTPPFNRPT